MPFQLGDRWVHDTVFRIGRYERMALAHAFSMHRYGTPQRPYDASTEFAGDLGVQLLNRAYMFFASHARQQFVATTYYYFHNYPAGKPVVLPLGNIRVPKAVYYAPVAGHFWGDPIVDNADIPAPPSKGFWVDLATDHAVTPGQILIQLSPLSIQSPFTSVVWNAPLLPQYTAFWGMPDWRVTDPLWTSTTNVNPNPAVARAFKEFAVGTLANTIVSVVPNALVPGQSFIRCVYPTQTFAPRWMVPVRGTAVPILSPAGVPRDAQVWQTDYYPFYHDDAFRRFFADFITIDELLPFEGQITNLTGSSLTVKPSIGSEVGGECVIAINGEVSFRPAFTLDAPDPNAPPGQGLGVDPSTNRLTPLMLQPIPTYEQLLFLENFLVPVAQCLYVSHLSSDDSRYEAEMAVLQEFVRGISVEPSPAIRSKLYYNPVGS